LPAPARVNRPPQRRPKWLPHRRYPPASKFARSRQSSSSLAEKVVYGEVWERPDLSKRDRSLITVATLVALGRERQLRGHLERALGNGVTKDEVGELITRLAFYAGWPAAMTAALVAKDVFEAQ